LGRREADRRRPDLARAQDTLSDPDVEDRRKLRLVGGLLQREPLLLVLDDFERNLEVGGRSFVDPGFAELFTALCATTGRGRLLVTCRHPVPGDAMSMLLEVPVPPLSRSELGRLFLRHPALRDLEAEDRRAVMRTIGGHPRLIELAAHVTSPARLLRARYGIVPCVAPGEVGFRDPAPLGAGAGRAQPGPARPGSRSCSARRCPG
jgi:hypothetical protein